MIQAPWSWEILYYFDSVEISVNENKNLRLFNGKEVCGISTMYTNYEESINLETEHVHKVPILKSREEADRGK